MRLLAPPPTESGSALSLSLRHTHAAHGAGSASLRRSVHKPREGAGIGVASGSEPVRMTCLSTSKIPSSLSMSGEKSSSLAMLVSATKQISAVSFVTCVVVACIAK